MSEFLRSNSLRKKALRSLGALSATAAFYGAGVGTYAWVSRPNTTKVERLATEAATAEQTAHDSAVGLANDYTSQLNVPGAKIANMKVLNGMVEVLGRNDKYEPRYKDAILLGIPNPNVVPDKDGNFLNGAWLGVVGEDQKGYLVITPTSFDSRFDKFVAYSPNEIVFSNLGVYSTEVNNSDGITTHNLVGFDLQGGKTLTNPDGSTIVPGLNLGGK